MSQPEEDFAPGDHLVPDERDPEAPADDAVEQATMADPREDEDAVPHRGLEVDDWDAMEQARVVGSDDGYDH
ncbi:hypothetical protein [Plantactinospora sp. KBS50]|uniref:hypothetical protein n=1 Tax=Plantactinospora sp. KBS50 TaxID=2024580 RepID=UPI000BAAA7F2|nr:hypothetical protein [Plantactinospora sp. KBS50]ASW53036.1 hypothetical protein CIK06_00785 [Plantactinospora sp. KBS50]